MDWDECFCKKFVKEIKTDTNLINSLIETSKDKLISNKKLPLEEATASTKICILYDSLREILEAIAIKKGFKIYNHECFTSFLKEICHKESIANEFDKFRIIRNKINYYGKKITINEAKIILPGIIKIRSLLLKEFLQ